VTKLADFHKGRRVRVTKRDGHDCPSWKEFKPGVTGLPKGYNITGVLTHDLEIGWPVRVLYREEGVEGIFKTSATKAVGTMSDGIMVFTKMGSSYKLEILRDIQNTKGGS